MKKNGFTLVELLAVVIILGIITTFALPNILNITKAQKIKACESKLNSLESAAKLYLQDYEDEYYDGEKDYFIFEGKNIYVTAKNLKDKGYADDITNPITKDEINVRIDLRITTPDKNNTNRHVYKATISNKNYCK